MGTIVVGIDGSPGSRRALEWAVREARAHSDEILAIYAWSYPIVVGMFDSVLPVPEGVDLEKEAAEFLQRTVDKIAGDAGVRIRIEVVQGSAGNALVDASRDADVLVVGSRGFGGFRGLLLGSTGQQCAVHAHCPVLIVPHEERERA